MRIVYHKFSNISAFCSKKDNFFSSQIILKTILNHQFLQKEGLSDAIKKNISEAKQITDKGKQDALAMFDPKQGFKLYKDLIEFRQRFRDARNSKSLYAINPNNSMLTTVARHLFQINNINGVQTIDVAFPSRVSYYVGTPGTAKSYCFFNLATIANMRVPYLISNPTMQKFIVEPKFKYFYFIAMYNKEQIVDYILWEIQKDFGSELAQKLRNQIKQTNNWQQIDSDFIRFQKCIRNLFKPYKALQINPYSMIDQFNYLYTKDGRCNNNLMWYNWRAVAKQSSKPVTVAASKNNEIVKDDDPAHLMTGDLDSIKKIFLDSNQIQSKMKNFMYSVCFELEKYGVDENEIEKVIQALKDDIPLASPLSVRLMIQNLVATNKKPKATEIIEVLKNYTEYEDVNRFILNLKNFFKSARNKQLYQIERRLQDNQDNSINSAQKHNVNQIKTVLKSSMYYNQSDSQQYLRFQKFINFFYYKDHVEISAKFHWKGKDYNLVSDVLQKNTDIKELQQVSMNYFAYTKSSNSQQNIFYSLFNQEQLNHVYKKIKELQIWKHIPSEQQQYVKRMQQNNAIGKRFQRQFKKTFNKKLFNDQFINVLINLTNLNVEKKIIQDYKIKLLTIKKNYKLPNITRATKWLNKKKDNNVQTKYQYRSFYQNQNNKQNKTIIQIQSNLKHQYSWQQFIKSIAQGQSYFSTYRHNKAFDFLFSRLQQNKHLNLYFVDTISSQQKETIDSKYVKFGVLIKQQNMQLLLQELVNTGIEKIQIHFIVLNYHQFQFQTRIEEIFSKKQLQKYKKQHKNKDLTYLKKCAPIIMSTLKYGVDFQIYSNLENQSEKKLIKFLI